MDLDATWKYEWPLIKYVVNININNKCLINLCSEISKFFLINMKGLCPNP
jgi:hypothetical protein